MINLYEGNCLNLLSSYSNQFFDLALFDPPYGVTQNKDDIPVNLSEIFRVSKGTILFSQQPYTTDVINQFRDLFRYDLIWDKVLTSGFLNANRMPLRKHEVILVFGKVIYHPQKTAGNRNHSKGRPKETQNNNYGKFNFKDNSEEQGNLKYPTSIISISKSHPSKALHRTEKPVELMKYLVETYSDIGNTILDPFMGSGSTGIACIETERNFVGIELNSEYFQRARERLNS